MRIIAIARTTLATSLLTFSASAFAVFFHIGNGSIDGSLCVGFDCVSAEPFGFDTIRLKENNLRLHFDDTSSAADFPDNDWRIIINDSADGGASYFSIQDATAGSRIFRLEAGARANALYVEDDGDVGIGTPNPATDLHVRTGNTPTYRMQQDGTAGFTPQTWDVAGNETNFFIRDATGGSTLPFRIRPGAPTSSIHIWSDGNVGIGTSSADESLHVRRTNGSAQLLVEEASLTQDTRELLRIKNNGPLEMVFDDENFINDWVTRAQGLKFQIYRQNAYADRLDLNKNGNLTIGGTLTENSDRNAKQDIEPVDAAALLDKVAALPISHWQYKDDPDVAHIGPMAQDFHAAFGLGASDTGISTLDSSGVALAAIQALNEKLAEQNSTLRAQNLSLEQRLYDQERRLVELEQQNQQIQAVVLRLAADSSETVASK